MKKILKDIKSHKKKPEEHISYEERVLFEDIQQNTAVGDLHKLDGREQEIFIPNPDAKNDKF